MLQTLLQTLLSDSLAHAIGWTLIGFVWQGAGVAAVTFLVLAALRQGNARVRYGIACFGLLVMLVLPIVTLTHQMRANIGSSLTNDSSTPTRAIRTAAPTNSSVSGSIAPPSGVTTDPTRTQGLEAWIPTVVSFWIVGVTILSLRTLAAWLMVQRMRRQGTLASERLCESVRVVASRLRVTRPVQVLESALVSVPTAIGSLRPVILWPATALTGLSPVQIEAVIAHELAHIRRLDYFVNLLQTAVETLLFYHPAAWILSGRIRIEREHCCDDLALSVCGDRLAYVKALASLEESRSDRIALAMGAAGGSLIERVQRLLGAGAAHDRRDPVWVVIGITTLIIALAFSGRDETLASRPQPPVPTVPHVETPALIASAKPIAPPRVQQPEVLVDHRRSWSSFGTRYEVRRQGSFTLTHDDRDFVAMSPNGYVSLTEAPLFGTSRTIELRWRPDGTIERKYIVGSAQQPYEPEGKAWLMEMLPGVIRRSGFAAEVHVAKILKQSGPAGVLNEIGQLQTDSVRRIYFTEFFKQAQPSRSMLSQTIEQASQQISSDHELGELLIALERTRTLNSSDWEAYFRAFDSIESSFERASVLIHVIERNKFDSHLRDLYREVANRISSKQERNRVLDALARNEQ